MHTGKTNSTQYIVCVCKTIIFIEEQERNLREYLWGVGGELGAWGVGNHTGEGGGRRGRDKNDVNTRLTQEILKNSVSKIASETYLKQDRLDTEVTHCIISLWA